MGKQKPTGERLEVKYEIINAKFLLAEKNILTKKQMNAEENEIIMK